MYNTLYKFVNTQQDGFCQILRKGMLFVSRTSTNMEYGRTQCLRQRTKQSTMEQSWIIRNKGNRRAKRKEKTEEERDEI